MLIDVHTHLNDEAFHGDIEEVVARALSAGVGRMVVAGYDLPSSAAAAAIAGRFPEVWATVGVSPHEAKTWGGDSSDELASLAERPKVVGIGEIGLDYHYELSPRAVQREVFRAQVALAVELGLPVVVHNREAHADTLGILREGRVGRVGGVMHCFTGSVETARAAWSMGLRISLAGPLTFKNANRPREVAAALPLAAFLTETDAPYLAPHPYRGRRNEPAYVGLVAAAMARIRGIPSSELEEAIWRNAEEVFRCNGQGKDEDARS